MNLIIVACHCVFKAGCTSPQAVELETSREGGFPGEGRFYREHVKQGVLLAAADPTAQLYFSGGQTQAVLPGRSEARSYYEVAHDHQWFQHPEAAGRTHCGEFARDSFENLQFSIAQYQHDTGQAPDDVIFVGWAFKAQRLELHCQGLRWPLEKFHYIGVNNPPDAGLEKALASEARLVEAVRADPCMQGQKFIDKRAMRNPFQRQPPYSMVR